MQVEVNIRAVDIGDVVPAATHLEEAGVDVVADGEIRRDPVVTMAVLARSTQHIRLATAISIAFARSPMVMAYTARNLHDLSGGRFSLGLGTQVKRHVERRFGAAWSAPGPRLRDYVQAIRDIWRAWDEGAPLAHHSEHYTIDYQTPEFDLGPSRHGPVDLAIAAVNSYNLTTAARAADTARLHAFCTPSYLVDVVLPHLDSAGGRPRPRIVGGGFVATGATDEQAAASRESARARIGFYGTTRTYRPVLDHHGWGQLALDLRARADAGRWDELAALVPDEVVDTFATTGTYGEIAPLLHERYGGIVDRVQLPCPPLDGDWGAFSSAVSDVHGIRA